jgi:hypothetical protein
MEYKADFSEYETADWLTYGGSLATLAVWIFIAAPMVTFLNIPLWAFLWIALPPFFVGIVMGSRRWSTALRKGPAAPLKDSESDAQLTLNEAADHADPTDVE